MKKHTMMFGWLAVLLFASVTSGVHAGDPPTAQAQIEQVVEQFQAAILAAGKAPQTDGAIASVYFDFSFLMDGKVSNVGSETWQMVNTGEGWKISAMAYSSYPDRAR